MGITSWAWQTRGSKTFFCKESDRRDFRLWATQSFVTNSALQVWHKRSHIQGPEGRRPYPHTTSVTKAGGGSDLAQESSYSNAYSFNKRNPLHKHLHSCDSLWGTYPFSSAGAGCPSFTGFWGFFSLFFRYSFSLSALSRYSAHFALILCLALSLCASSSEGKCKRVFPFSILYRQV